MRCSIPLWRHIAFFALLLAFASATTSRTLATQTVHTTPQPNGSADHAGDIGSHNHYIRGDGDLPQPGSPKASTSPPGHDEAPRTVLYEATNFVCRLCATREPGHLTSAETSKSASEGYKVVLEPQHLDFRDRPIGIPVVEQIRVENKDETKEMVISSISHDSSLFQLKFYRPITVAPKGNTSIEIVLVARTTGAFESQIVLVTSCGSFVVELAGVMTPNPYRLSPFMSVKVPVGELFEPTIVIYNPHYEVLSVKEIYTSSGFLHLQLPDEARNFSSSEFEMNGISGSTETQKLKFWDLAPHESKSLISLRFLSHKSGKYQDTVTIQTNFDELMIHVDVSVVSGSLHKLTEELDFGVLTVQDTKYLNLSLLNSGSTTLQVTDLHVTGSTEPNLVIELLPAILSPNHQSVVASLTFHARSEGQFKGKLLLRTNDTNPVNTQMLIPYRVQVLSGYISYPAAQTSFPAFDAQVNKKGELVKIDALAPRNQELILTNKFSVPLVLYSAEIDDIQLRVVNFVPSQQAEPGESWPALTIEFRPKLRHLQLFTTHLHLITNATLISIPLHIYHGKLAYTTPAEAHWYSVGPLAVSSSEKSTLHVSHDHLAPSFTHVNKHAFEIQPLSITFGTIPVNEIQTRTLNISNPNPAKLSILGLWTDVEGLSIKLESVWNAQGYRSVADIAFKSHKPSLFDERISSTSSSAPSRSNSASSSSKNSEKKRSTKSKSVGSTEMFRTAGAPMFEILPGQSVLLSLELLSPREMQAQGYIYFVTAQERSAINVTFHSLAGNLALIPDTFVFDQSHPSEVPLYLQHSYSQSIAITSITSNDERLQVHLPKSADSSIGSQDERHLWLQPHKQVVFGSVSFKPVLGPKSLAQVQAESSVLAPGVDFLSVAGAEKLRHRMEAVGQSQQQTLKVTLTVTTDLPTTHGFPVQVQRWRPSLLAMNNALKSGELDFGIVEVESGEREVQIELKNPLDENFLLVQLQLSTVAHLHPPSSNPHDDPSASIQSCAGAFDFANDSSTRLISLSPHETRLLGPIVFHPGFEGRCISTLFIRNNFTTVESLLIHGVGAGGQIDFEHQLARSSRTHATASIQDVENIEEPTTSKAKELLFQLTDAELEGCEEIAIPEPSNKAKASLSQSDSSSIEKRAEWTAPQRTERLSVFNRGTLPLSVESVFVASKLPYGKSSSSFTRSQVTMARIEEALNSDYGKSSPLSSFSASHPSEGSQIGGFTVKNSEDVMSVVLWPGARRYIEIGFSPDFSAAESQYDLVIRTNSSREFRFPLRGVISEQKQAACAHRFKNSRFVPNGRQSVVGSLFDVRFGLVIVACMILLGLYYAERRWTAVSKQREEEQLPSLHTPKIASSDKTRPTKNDHPQAKLDNSSSKAHHRGQEDLENHSSPVSISHPSVSSQLPSFSKEKKKDKKDAKNKQSTVLDKASQSTSKTKKPKHEELPSFPSSLNAGSDNTGLKGDTSHEASHETVKYETSPKTSISSSVPSTGSVTAISGSKKKDKKDKKDMWPLSNPVEPNFGVSPNSRPTDERASSKKDSTPGSTSSNAEVPDRKRKKSMGATSAPPAGEIREVPSAASNGSSSPPLAAVEREKSASEKHQVPTETRQTSPPPQRPQTLVPAKRPSSKPVPKYARKDGLNKDGSTPSAPATGIQEPASSEKPSEIGSSVSGSVSGPVVVSGKESKKQRLKEQRKAERQALLLEKGQKSEKVEKSEKSSENGVPSASMKVKPAQETQQQPQKRVLPSFGPNQQQMGQNTAWSQNTPLLPLPQLQVVNPSGNIYGTPPQPPSGGASPTTSLKSPAGTTPPHFGSLGLGSSLTGDAPLLVSPGALSANRYDYGRRGPGALRSSGGYGSSFDFSMAPSFDTGSLSRENSLTPPLNVGTGPQPPMRLYNPMAPQGSVENLLASLRDPELSNSEPGSVNSTPRDYSMFNMMMMGGPQGGGSSTGSSDSPMDPAWQALTHGSIWTVPTSERAVEENVSHLSLLGLGSTPIVQPNHLNAGAVAPSSSSAFHSHPPTDFGIVGPGGTQYFSVGHGSSSSSSSSSSPSPFPGSPTLPPGLQFTPSPDPHSTTDMGSRSGTSSSEIPSPTASPPSIPPLQQDVSSFFSSKLNSSSDLWKTTHF